MNGKLMLNILNWFANKPDFPNGINSNSNLANLPSKFYLYQNYPNPFNSETLIKYELPQNTNIKISIYNSLGQEIAILANSHQYAGYHQIRWEGINSSGNRVSSGLYFVRMKTDNIIIAKKLLLLR